MSAALSSNRKTRSGGFTLIEALIVSAVLVPVLFTVINTTGLLRRSLDTTDRSASVSELIRNFGQHVGEFTRSGVLSTCKVRATAADVAYAETMALTQPGYYIPTVDEWISPPNDVPRDNIQFQSADGLLSMNAKALTTPRSLEFALESGETANGKDDDGDGSIDEGTITLDIGSAKISLCEGAELCTFQLQGRVLYITLQVARRDRSGNVIRAKSTHAFYMRNN